MTCLCIIFLKVKEALKMRRNAVVAGQFYEATKERLSQQLKECFLSERGPGRLPRIHQQSNRVKGVVVPHAGYIYSGAIAAHAYNVITDQGFADIFIILGPNHTGIGSGVSLMSNGTWETPLGDISINQSLAENLRRGIIDEDHVAHLHEHSIEVQLPFLQFCSENTSFEFIPICMAMQDWKTADEIGRILAEVIQQTEKTVCVIASSDFSHVGFNYMSMPPPGMTVHEYAEKQDKLAIEKILSLDPKGLITTVENSNITMCGYGPVAAMLTTAKLLGAKNGELLKYGTSYEVHPGSSCVGYGAITIY